MRLVFNPFTGSLDFVGDVGTGSVPDPLTVNNLTVNTLLTAAHIHGNLAGSLYLHVKNTSGAVIPKRTPVYVTGSVGSTTRLEVAAADNTDPAKMPVIGITNEELAINADGHAVLAGEVTDVDTSAFAVGDELFPGPAGTLVKQVPSSGTVQSIAIVGRVNQNTGTIAVTIGAELARVAYTGDYTHLANKPTLGDSATRNIGTTAGTVAAGDDPRMASRLYAVGKWIAPIDGQYASGTAVLANTISLIPFCVYRKCTTDALGVRIVGGVASSTFDIAVYASSQGEPAGLPVAVASGLSGATATVVSGTVSPVTLEANTIYFGAVNSASALNFQAPSSSSSVLSNILGASSLAIVSSGATIASWYLRVTSTYGSWPDLTGVTATPVSGNNSAALFLRVSALP